METGASSMKPTDVNPLGRVLLVKPHTAQDSLKGGLVLPDNVTQDRSDQGVVVSRGDESTIDAGTKVIFNRYSAEELFIDDVKYLLVNQDDVFATIK